MSYKLEREHKQLIEIDRWFPSSHIGSDCLTQIPKISLDIREWICPNVKCNKRHDPDEAASRNIRGRFC
ncbi:transposase [Pleurocapsales cyanobacterium LEGE 06147]|nr:transposase [Pleurocapsales cyanobacterium LEGE 06147]